MIQWDWNYIQWFSFLGCRIAASMASGDAFPSGEIGSGIGQKIPMQRSTANQFNNLSPPFASTWTDIVNPDGCASALHFVCMGAGALSSKLFPYQQQHQQQEGIPVGCIPPTCVEWQTDTCENITFPPLCWRTVTIKQKDAYHPLAPTVHTSIVTRCQL